MEERVSRLPLVSKLRENFHLTACGRGDRLIPFRRFSVLIKE